MDHYLLDRNKRRVGVLYRVIKWITMVTKLSKENAKNLDIPVAVIINYTFGGLTSLAVAFMLYGVVEVAFGNLNFYDLRVFAIAIVCLAVIWIVSIRIVEIWLETLNNE